THPAFLVLDSPDGKTHGTRSLAKIADASRASSAEEVIDAYERRFFAIYPASAKLQSWDIFASMRQVLDVLDPVVDPLPEDLRAELGLIFEDEALRAIHVSQDERERQRARERLTFDEAVGLQWGLAARRHGEVGSGKTIVAVLAMLQMVDAGYQCALLAPTEVLAAQHLRSIRDVLGELAMAGQLGGAENATRVALLTG